MNTTERKFLERQQRNETVQAVKQIARTVSEQLQWYRKPATQDPPEIQKLRDEWQETAEAIHAEQEETRKTMNRAAQPFIDKLNELTERRTLLEDNFRKREEAIRLKTQPGFILPLEKPARERWIGSWLFDRLSHEGKVFELTTEQLIEEFQKSLKNGWRPRL